MSLSLRQAESYTRVAKKWGVRGYPSGMIPGIARLFPIWFRQEDAALFDSVPDTLAEIEANLQFGRKNNGAADGRIANVRCRASSRHRQHHRQVGNEGGG